MELSQAQIAEFQTLYRKHFGEDISVQEAQERGTEMVELVQFVLTKPTQTYEK